MPLDDIAVGVIVRRLDQDDEEAPCGRGRSRRPTPARARRRNRQLPSQGFENIQFTDPRVLAPEPLSRPHPGLGAAICGLTDRIIPKGRPGGHGFDSTAAASRSSRPRSRAHTPEPRDRARRGGILPAARGTRKGPRLECHPPPLRPPTTRRSILPIVWERRSSASRVAAMACSSVLLFEPNTTMPPSTAPNAAIKSAGS